MYVKCNIEIRKFLSNSGWKLREFTKIIYIYKKNRFLVILTGFIVKYVVTESVTNNIRPDNYSL